MKKNNFDSDKALELELVSIDNNVAILNLYLRGTEYTHFYDGIKLYIGDVITLFDKQNTESTPSCIKHTRIGHAK